MVVGVVVVLYTDTEVGWLNVVNLVVSIIKL
jgi:hypothetical protein